jgi:hypothetical protein
MLFGMNPDTDKILGFLGKTREDFGRFRNVYMEDGYIVVFTRNGGGNRDDYFPEWVTDHPWYSHDADDDFDCTYANIYFKVPDDANKTLLALHDFDKGADPKVQWASMLGMMESLKK